MAGEQVSAEPGHGAHAPEPAERELLARAHELIVPHVLGHVAAFYATLMDRPGPRTVFDRLTLGERENLLERQAEHVLRVLSPETTTQELHDHGFRMGRVHARAGVEMDWYVSAVADHQRGIYELLLPHRDSMDCARTATLLNERFMLDLHGALQGYRESDRAENAVLRHVTRVCAESRTVADLARGVMEALTGLDGMTVAFIGRPDEHDVFVFEAGAGRGVEEFIAETQEPGALSVTASARGARGRGPAGQAWRSGEIARSDDYRHDPETAPWREWSLRWGWRSSAAVPLRDPRGRPIALLSLYAGVPGFFAYPSRAEMLEQVQHVVEAAFSQLEGSPAVASEVRSYTDRRRYLDRLEHGGLEMHFQPVVDLRTGRPSKFEALARLRENGTVASPAEFLPALGDEELLTLFRLGLEQSLGALERWEREGLVTGVSVNLPVSSGTDRRYVDALDEVLGRHQVDPGRVTLELLETGDVLGPLAQRRAAMDELKHLGVRLAQDDLGSGYSSLLRLRHFPFDEVKVDKNLVRSTEAAPRTALHFVHPITDIAHSLGMTVVMEGLETEGLVEAALQLGADGGQGYALARPMPADQVVPWVRGFHLGLDRESPRTHLGALAAHVAWEHQVTALRGDPANDAVVASLSCPLVGYLGRSTGTFVVAHREVHEHALAQRGSAAHRAAWERLVLMLGDGA